MTRTFITGDSHCVALKRALAKMGEAAPPVAVGALGNGAHMAGRFFEPEGNELRLLPAKYQTRLAELTGTDRLLPEHRYGLCMGLHSARVFRHPMWRQYRLLGTPEGDHRQPLSGSVFEQIVHADSRHILSFLSECRQRSIDVFVIAAPAPRRNHKAIADGTPSQTVATVAQRYRQQVAARIEALGVRCIMPPPETVDDEGFLLPEYENDEPGDPHHANASFGVLVMRLVDQYLQTQR